MTCCNQNQIKQKFGTQNLIEQGNKETHQSIYIIIIKKRKSLCVCLWRVISGNTMSTLNETFWDWLRLLFRVTLGINIILMYHHTAKKIGTIHNICTLFFPV